MTTETIYDQTGQAFDLPGVYSDFPNFFRLVHNLQGSSDPVTLFIDEPPGWSSLRMNLSRSREWHAVSYEYSTQEKSLEFNGDSGRDFIQSIFLNEGEDAEVLLEFGLHVPGSLTGAADLFIVEFRSRLNLETYENKERRITCALERKSLHSLVSAKWDKEVSILSATALNGTLLTPPELVEIPLTSQALTERLSIVVGAGAAAEQTFSGDTDGHLWIQFDTAQPQTSEIEEFVSGKTLGLSDSSGPIDLKQYLLKMRSSGTYDVLIDLSFRLWVTPKKKTVSLGPAYVTGYMLGAYLTVVSLDGTRKDYPIGDIVKVGSRARQDFREKDVSITYSGVLKQAIDLKKGDEVYLYGLYSFDHNKNELQQTQAKVQLITNRVSIKGTSMNAASAASGFALIDALNTVLTVITGLPDRFRSAYYGLKNGRYPVDGCGSRRVVMNGFAVRRFKPTEKPLNLSLRDALQSLQSMDCVGMEYGTEIQTDGTLIDVMRVEPIEHFYRPVELLRLDEVGEYRERAVTEDVVSTVDVGYNDWISEGVGALEEIFTTHQVQTPIRNGLGTKSFISKFITSSLAIERTRRYQYDTTPKDGTTYDDKPFLIQCKPIPAVTGHAEIVYESFLGVTIILLDEPIGWLAAGTKVAFSGPTDNKGTFTVGFVSDQNKRPWSFYVREELTSETVETLTISSTGGLDLQPEVGADFAQVTGLASADDTYNLRLTPARMLLKNIALWAGALIGKNGTTTVVTPKSYPYQGKITTVRVEQFVTQITVDEVLDWIVPGVKIVLGGPTFNPGAHLVKSVGDPTLTPWTFTVVGALTDETTGSVIITLPDTVPPADQVTKTRLPGNAKVVTVLPTGDGCGAPGIVRENAPINVDEIIPKLIFRAREITFKQRLSKAQIQRLRLGSVGLLPVGTDADGKPDDRNYGYVSLLNQEGLRVAGYLMDCDWSNDDEEARFVLRQTALDLGDTSSGLDCTQFVGWTRAQVETANAQTRRRIGLCTWSDVDPR